LILIPNLYNNLRLNISWAVLLANLAHLANHAIKERDQIEPSKTSPTDNPIMKQ
jgi:hypothetical protein